ncbi:MAG: hypothetical protein IT370_08120 [Deltaproteobacteria bacterium]|nr:hypothetical protein [Deltaproteobacteria bacterium]
MRKLVLLLLLALARPALADSPDPDAEREAKRLYQDGTKAYNLGDYARAIMAYKEAYRLIANPFFLYNIGQAYRLSGEPASAVRFYKSYLNAMPEAPNRVEVEGRIREIDETLARQERERVAPPTHAIEPRAKIPSPGQVETAPGDSAAAAPSHDRPRPLLKRWWFWAGVGVVATGATIFLLTRGGSDAPPASDFGNHELFP